MIEGSEPSVGYAMELLKLAQITEMNFLRDANGMDFRKKKAKKQVAANMQKEFEAKRLLALGRPASDLDKFDAEISQRLTHGLKHLEQMELQEEKKLETLLAEQLKDKLKVQSDYNERVGKLTQQFMGDLEQLKGQYAVKFAALPEGSNADSREVTKEKLALDQELSAELAALEVRYHDNLCNTFADSIARKVCLCFSLLFIVFST